MYERTACRLYHTIAFKLGTSRFHIECAGGLVHNYLSKQALALGEQKPYFIDPRKDTGEHRVFIAFVQTFDDGSFGNHPTCKRAGLIKPLFIADRLGDRALLYRLLYITRINLGDSSSDRFSRR